MSDRTVHAVCADGREIVRYERAGKWWIEHTSARVRLSVQSAAEIAAVTTRLGGEVFFGRPGGTAFDKRVRDYLAARSDRGSVDTAYLWLGSTAVGCGCLMLLAPVFAWIAGVLIGVMVVAAVGCAVGRGARR